MTIGSLQTSWYPLACEKEPYDRNPQILTNAMTVIEFQHTPRQINLQATVKHEEVV